MARRFREKETVSAAGASHEAVAVWDIAQEIVSSAKKNKVFLVHMPRGATPIVDGINYATAKLVKGRRPYGIVRVPLSRENFPRPEHARKIISDALEAIPKNAVVYYVDESRVGFVTSANLEDIERVLRRKGCLLRAHFLVADAGKALNRQAMETFQKSKATVELHEIPGKISWRDNTPVLGYNWGLMHRFPEEILGRAIGRDKIAKSEIERLKKEFLKRYDEKIRLGKEKKFREVLYSSAFYARRQQMAIAAFLEAAKATGFGERHALAVSGEGVKVNGKTIPFWNLNKFLLDNHPRTEMETGSQRKRIAYRCLVLSDPHTLVDIRQMSPQSIVNNKRLKREIGTLFQRGRQRRK